MSSDKFQTTLGEICSFRRGISYKGSELAESEENGIPMINMKSFSKEGKYRPEGIKFYNGVSQEKDFIKPDEIVLANTDLTKEGDILGAAVMIPDDLDGKCVIGSHHTTILTINDKRIVPEYLVYLINSPLIRTEIKRYRRGATVKGITTNDLKNIAVQVPLLDEQKRIVAILDKAEGIESLSRESPAYRTQLIKSIFSNLFGNKLISNKHQENFVQLSTISRKTKNLDPRTRPNMEFEMYSIPAFDLGSPQVLQGSEIGSSKKILIENDVVISRLIPHIRRVWVIPKTGNMMKLGSSEWIVFNSENFNPIFLQYLLSSDEFHKYFMNSVAGVGGSLVRARPIVVMGLYIKRPTMDLQNIFAHNVESIKSLPDINDLTIQNSKSLSQEMLT